MNAVERMRAKLRTCASAALGLCKAESMLGKLSGISQTAAVERRSVAEGSQVGKVLW